MHLSDTLIALRKCNEDIKSLQQALNDSDIILTQLRTNRNVRFEYNLEAAVKLAMQQASAALLTDEAQIAQMKEALLAMALKPIEVDETRVRNQLQETMGELPKIIDIVNQLMENFDRLFGSSSARDILTDVVRKNTPKEKVTYEDVVDLGDAYEKLCASLTKVNDMHSDAFISVARVVCFNMTGMINSRPTTSIGILIKRQIHRVQYMFETPEKLLKWYIFYSALVMFALWAFPLLTSVVMAGLMVTTIISTINYNKYLREFKSALSLQIKLEQVAADMEDCVQQHLKEQEEIQRKKNEEEVDKHKALIAKAEEALREKRDALLSAEKEIREKEREKERAARDVFDDKFRQSEEALKVKEQEYRNQQEELEELKLKKYELENNIMLLSGLQPGLPTEQKEQIVSSNMLVGFDETTGEPVMLDIKEPTYISGDKDTVNYIVSTILLQLLGRVLPTKVIINVYAPKTLGRQYVKFINKSEGEEGVIILPNEKAFSDVIKEYESNSIEFQYSLKDFDGIDDYNEFMLASDSVTRGYIVTILESLPNDLEVVQRFGPELGHYWIALDKPIREDDIEAFDSIFKNQVGY